MVIKSPEILVIIFNALFFLTIALIGFFVGINDYVGIFTFIILSIILAFVSDYIIAPYIYNEVYHGK